MQKKCVCYSPKPNCAAQWKRGFRGHCGDMLPLLLLHIETLTAFDSIFTAGRQALHCTVRLELFTDITEKL